MTPAARMLRAARMRSLLLTEPQPLSPAAVVEWFGAMQAQDVNSGHWSLGVRCAGSTEETVVDAFEAGEVVRTWPMRGTIHMVPAQDVGWLLEHVGSRTLTGSEARRGRLGLSLADADRAAVALDVALAGGRVLTRAEALQAITEAGIGVEGQRGYHLLWYAAQTGVACIGPQRGGDQTFVRLADWAPDQVVLPRQEALAELFHRFVRSHGPVPIQDFVGWTGLTLGDSKIAARDNAGRLEPLPTSQGEMWVTTELAEALLDDDTPVHDLVALPGFDEFLLGYKDRTLQVPPGAFERIVPGGNGMFRATVVSDGLVVATWKRNVTARRVTVEVEPLDSDRGYVAGLEEAFGPYAFFLGRELELRVTAGP